MLFSGSIRHTLKAYFDLANEYLETIFSVSGSLTACSPPYAINLLWAL